MFFRGSFLSPEIEFNLPSVRLVWQGTEPLQNKGLPNKWRCPTKLFVSRPYANLATIGDVTRIAISALTYFACACTSP